MTVGDAAAILGLKPESVSKMARLGRIPGAIKHEETGRWFVPHESVEQYRQTRLGKRGARKGAQYSPVRRVVQLRLNRVGFVRASETAQVVGVTPTTIAKYLREAGARYDTKTNLWYAS